MNAHFSIKAGMFIYGLALLLGVVLLQQFSVLPSRLFLLSSGTFLLVSVYFSFRYFAYSRSTTREFLNLFLIVTLLIYSGFFIASFVGQKALNERLDDDFTGKDIIVTGVIASIPGSSGNAQRFEFEVDDYRLLDEEGDTDHLIKVTFPKKIRISWYHGNEVNADEKWQFEVRLKPPHGFMNPGGFDYEAWLFQHGIDATGYVRKSRNNQRLHYASKWSVNRMRQSLGLRIDQLAQESPALSTLGLVKALAIGDKSSISKQQWQVLTNTGTSHLMAISGLHIGLAALFANILTRRFIPVMFLKTIPAQHIALIMGVVMATLYALVAGLSIPTQRALIMLVTLSVLLLLRRNHRPLDALGFALVVVLLIDPLAVLSVGFWFSFSAVAVIFISVTSVKQDNSESSLWLKIKTIVKHWFRLQLIISLFLLPLSLFMFQQVSLVSPLANLLLIPYVSFFVVPVVLLAILFSFVTAVISDILFEIAAVLLELVWPLLSSLSAQDFALWQYDGIGISGLLLASFSLLLFYYSRKISLQHYWSLRCLSVIIFLACFLEVLVKTETALEQDEIQLTVLDVGQGSAAVIQTKNHTLVFDAGAKFSNKLDTGSNIIIPFLRSKKLQTIDALVISHGDSDHIGGAQSLLDAYPDVTLIGQDIEKLKSTNKQPCFSGLEWQWDGVNFKFLSPLKQRDKNRTGHEDSRNNHSCVLRVSSSFGSILLTGDIENEIEQKLLKKYRAQLASDVLIVPHHGSNTSSTMAFIAAVNPKLSIISVGYNNRYHLPNTKVLARYARYSTYSDHRLLHTLLQTQSSGAISLVLKGDEIIKFQQFRKQSLKYWHHNAKNNE